MLKEASQFYKFKSELKYLDNWIQEQIDKIKIDGVGKNLSECENLLKETEEFARHLIAKEERVKQFGNLSQEIINQNPVTTKVITKHPVGKISK